MINKIVELNLQILLFSAVNAVGIDLAYETAVNASFPLDMPA